MPWGRRCRARVDPVEFAKDRRHFRNLLYGIAGTLYARVATAVTLDPRGEVMNARVSKFCLLALACALGSAGASAEDRDDAPTAHVYFGDLNLGNPTGVQMLYRRINLAANKVCGQADLRDLRATERKEQCIEHAIDEAIATVNNPKLSALRQSVRHHGNG
jgi:UrcA family protein